jgi:hypothetical protein
MITPMLRSDLFAALSPDAGDSLHVYGCVSEFARTARMLSNCDRLVAAWSTDLRRVTQREPRRRTTSHYRRWPRDRGSYCNMRGTPLQASSSVGQTIADCEPSPGMPAAPESQAV